MPEDIHPIELSSNPSYTQFVELDFYSKNINLSSVSKDLEITNMDICTYPYFALESHLDKPRILSSLSLYKAICIMSG